MSKQELATGFASKQQPHELDDKLLMRFYANCTKRQQEVIELASDGHTNREVGERLHITSGSVSEHLTHIYAELGTLEAFTGLTVNRSLLTNRFARFFDRHPEMRNEF